ncbi:hypothetical protein B0181_11790 [Moraxella caviae]|uniref:Filamentation induced by cAMP protein Fic-like C-terminal domain-containing protein n=1 Tax=Moraxella caviae TaxID=34060 RepID=A0A1S9ZR41_9GAMM|nr:hypothetical protein B0181_11790 [Moraxella caviae]
MVLLIDEPKSIKTLMMELQISHRTYFRKRFLQKALEQGLIEMTITDKPSSRNQQYRLTKLGLQLISSCAK